MPRLTIHAAATRFYISTAPAMPTIVLTALVDGRPAAGANFRWQVGLSYPRFITVDGGSSRNVVPKTHPAMPPLVGNPVTVTFRALMGGQLTVSVEGVVAGQRLSATRNDIYIGGTNPTNADLAGAVGVRLMRQMIQQESGSKQFSNTAARAWVATALNPNWSSDNLRGVGLGQLTIPAPSDADIWNWRTNAADLQSRYREKRTPGTTLHTRVAQSARFAAEVAALNQWRAAENLPPIRVNLPALTAEQLDNEGLRAYNGFGARVAGQYLSYIHEYEPETTVLTSTTRRAANGTPLRSPRVPVIDATGNARWRQISGAERIQRSGASYGDPNYVANVRGQPG